MPAHRRLDRLGPDGRLRVQPATRPDGRRRLVLIGTATAVVAVAVGVGMWRLVASRPSAPAPAHPPVTVLIADFENQANDPVFDGSLEQPLGVAMEGASFITTLSAQGRNPDRAAAATRCQA